MRRWTVLLGFLALSCCATLRVDDEIPNWGNPYQKIFLVKKIHIGD